MIYNKNGITLVTAYDYQGTAASMVYDVDGNPLLDVFDSSTTLSTIYTSTITSQPQGGCTDGNGNIYTCFPSVGIFSKYNINTGVEITANFTAGAYGHGNDMTYNPNTGYLYLTAMESDGRVLVLDTSFNLVDTIYLMDDNGEPTTCWNISYDRVHEWYVTINAYGPIYYYDENFNIIKTAAYTQSDWPTTHQNAETDGKYIYAVSYNPNNIYVFTMDGGLVAQISNTGFTGEPEALMYDWTNDVFYIEGKATNYVIRSVEFRGGAS